MMKIHSIPLRTSWVMTCAFEQSRNELVACGGLDNLCSVYKINQPQVMRASSELAGHDGYLSCCRFVDESRILTTSGDSMCILWDVERNESVVQFTDHTGDVMGVAIHPHSPKLFVTGSCDSTAKFWDCRTPRQPTITFTGHDSDINSVAFFPDGEAFGTGSDDSTCRIFDLRCLMCISRFKSDKVLCGITSVEFSHSGRILFAGYDDFNVYCWDVIKDGLSVQRLYPQDSNVQFYKHRDCRHLWTLSGHDNRVSCLGMCPTGEALCTGSWDTLLKIWS